MNLFKKTAVLFSLLVSVPLFASVQAQSCSEDETYYELDFWVGDWEVFGTRTGEPAGTNVIEKILNGCALFEQWIGADGYTGTSLTFIDPETDMWAQLWVDNMGGSQHYWDGVLDNSAVRFSYETIDEEDNEVMGRMILIRLSDTGVRQLNQTSYDDGQNWQTLYDLTYIRRN